MRVGFFLPTQIPLLSYLQSFLCVSVPLWHIELRHVVGFFVGGLGGVPVYEMDEPHVFTGACNEARKYDVVCMMGSENLNDLEPGGIASFEMTISKNKTISKSSIKKLETIVVSGKSMAWGPSQVSVSPTRVMELFHWIDSPEVIESLIPVGVTRKAKFDWPRLEKLGIARESNILNKEELRDSIIEKLGTFCDTHPRAVQGMLEIAAANSDQLLLSVKVQDLLNASSCKVQSSWLKPFLGSKYRHVVKDAIVLIGRYGEHQDWRILEPLTRSEAPAIARAAKENIKILRAKPKPSANTAPSK